MAAPTSKAAVRISEAMRENRVPLRAKTIHSMLGVAQAGDDGNWGFQHCESNPLPFKYIVVDESSMIDAGLMASLLAARAKGTGSCSSATSINSHRSDTAHRCVI